MSETKRPTQKLSARAFDEGKAARTEQKPRDACPYTTDQRPQVRAWEQGWDSAPPPSKVGPLTDVRVSVPAGVQVRVEASSGDCFVPADVDIAKLVYYVKPSAPPCPSCRRKKLDSGSQACVYMTPVQGGGLVWFRCRACGHGFKVPVR